jgi:hypothetical protein
VHARLADTGLPVIGLFTVPNSVKAITPLVGQIQIESEAHRAKGEYSRVYVFHNNIDDLLEKLRGSFHRLRQSGIDEELFDVISGFEALTGARRSC